MKIQEFEQFMEEANQDFFKNAIEGKQLNPIQKLDKDCLDSHIEELIVLTNKANELEAKIAYQKEAIQEYASENGVLYSDSSHSVSLVYSPKVVYRDAEIRNCDLHIEDYEKQIKALKEKQDAFKEQRKERINVIQSLAKKECEEQGKGINEVWKDVNYIYSLKDSFQVRISKSKINKETNQHESEFERSWIYKK